MYYEQTEVGKRFRLEDDKPQADDDVDDDEESTGINGNDTFSANGDEDEDEFSDHKSIAEDTVTNNATVT